MRFGTAKELITPDQLSYMSGYGSFFNRAFTGIHDDLYAKALYLGDGRSSVLLISVDLLFFDFEIVRGVQIYAREKYGLPEEAVFVSCTHTHSGPALTGYGDRSQHSAAYETFLKDRLKSLVDRIMLNQMEGTVEYGFVQGDWNINRRARIDGVVINAPNHAGMKDDQLHLLKLTDSDGCVRGLFLNYACHPVTVTDNLLLSADFPGRLCQLLEAELFGCTAVFFQGAGGNARPKVTAVGGRFLKRTYMDMGEMALSMSGRIKAALYGSEVFTPVRLNLASCQFLIDLPLEPFPLSEVKRRATALESSPALHAMALHVSERYDELPDEVRLPAGIISLADDLYIAYLGGEPCYEVKKKLHEAVFHGKRMMFIGYADAAAYIPDDTILVEGGYEANGSALEYGLKGGFQAGIDRRIEEAFRSQLPQVAR